MAKFKNTVWDSTAGAYVAWLSDDDYDTAGASYPGPGTFGVHTSQYRRGEIYDAVIASATDDTAVHTDVAAEINGVAEKGTPVTGDLLLIEDSAAANVKKKIQVGNLPGGSGTDADAIHDNVAGEIAAITAKATPTTSDYLVIEDAADSNNKKSITLGDLPGGSGTDADAIHDNVAGEIAAVTLKATPTTSDLLLIEDAAATNNKKRITIGTLRNVRGANIVIGNSAAGDVASDCDVLDAGDGTLLKSTIEGASAGDYVFIRAGTYDLGSGPQTRISQPSQVKVSGAGRYQTHVKAWTGADGRAWAVGALSELRDIYVEAPAPTTQTVAGAVIEGPAGGACWLKNVRVFFTGAWPAAASVAITAGFKMLGGSALRIDDCWFWGMPDGVSGAAQVNGIDVSTTNSWISRLRLYKGYDAFKSNGAYINLDGFDFQNFSHNGIYHSGSSRTSYAHGLMRGKAYAGITHDGIVLYTAAGAELGVNVSDVYMTDSAVASTGVLGYGISLQNVDRCVVSNCRIFGYGADGSRLGAIHLDANTSNNVVALNTLGGNTLVDLGTNNDVAHNI